MLCHLSRILCFFAHPDDETLAMGGTIRKLIDRGIEVFVAISNTGIEARRPSKEQGERELAALRADCENAMDVLGVPSNHLFLGNFSDNESDKHTLLELINWLEAIVNKVRPDAVFTHHARCTNIDHRYCHEAAVVATRPTAESRIELYCAEVPSSTGYLRPTAWEPTLFVELSAEQVECKVESMNTYRGEARPDPHPRSPEVLRALAKVRGAESGFLFAEAFMVHKSYF